MKGDKTQLQQSRLLGKRWTFLAIALGLCLICIGAYVVQPALNTEELERNIAKWQTKAPSNYEITVIGYPVDYGYSDRIGVANGKIVYETNPHADTYFKVAPIETFFAELSRCVSRTWECSVEYDSEYGYPTSIQRFCLQDCLIFQTRLTNFQPNPHIENF